jgi:Family of unknown function (DUF5906)
MNNVIPLQPIANQMRDAISELNKEFAVVALGSSIRVVWERSNPTTGQQKRDFLSRADFGMLLMNRFSGLEQAGSAAEFFLKHPRRREYASVDFYPGKAPEGMYNLWQGFAIQAKPGNSDRFWTFVREVICSDNAAAYRFVRKWLAHMIQRPEELPETALVLRGEQGIGKNTFADTIGALVRPHYLSVVSLDQLTGQFNGHLSDKILVYANEAIWGGSKQREGALKAMITDKNLPYEYKGKDIAWMGNYKRLIVGSNEDWAVPRGVDDRRFFVLDVSNKHKGDEPYWADLKRDLESGMLAAIMDDLQTEDLSGFNPRRLPQSGAGLDMKLKSATSVERYVYELLAQEYRLGQPGVRYEPLELNPEGQYVRKDKVYESYRNYCYGAERERPEPETSFWKKVRKIFPSLRERRGTGAMDGRIREVSFLSLSDARAALARYFSQPIDWPSEPQEPR